MISDYRRTEIKEAVKLLFMQLDFKNIKGVESLAQIIQNRCLAFCKTQDEFKFMTDELTAEIKKTKGKDAKIIYRNSFERKGRELRPEEARLLLSRANRILFDSKITGAKEQDKKVIEKAVVDSVAPVLFGKN